MNQEKVGKSVVTTFIPSTEIDRFPNDGPSMAMDIPIDCPEEFLDNRGLVPPEPMERTLAKLDELPMGTVLVIHNDRVPVFLLGQLDDDGYPYEIHAQVDDSAIVRILKTH